MFIARVRVLCIIFHINIKVGKLFPYMLVSFKFCFAAQIRLRPNLCSIGKFWGKAESGKA